MLTLHLYKCKAQKKAIGHTVYGLRMLFAAGADSISVLPDGEYGYDFLGMDGKARFAEKIRKATTCRNWQTVER